MGNLPARVWPFAPMMAEAFPTTTPPCLSSNLFHIRPLCLFFPSLHPSNLLLLSVSCSSNSLDMKAAAQWSCHLLPSSPLMCLQETMMYGLMWTASIRPLVFPDSIEHNIFLLCASSDFYSQIDDLLLLLLFYCYYHQQSFRSFPQWTHLFSAQFLLFFSQFHYLCVLSFPRSSLLRQHILLPQQHVY